MRNTESDEYITIRRYKSKFSETVLHRVSVIGREKSFSRLAVECFVGSELGKLQVDHFNRNTDDNSKANLSAQGRLFQANNKNCQQPRDDGTHCGVFRVDTVKTPYWIASWSIITVDGPTATQKGKQRVYDHHYGGDSQESYKYAVEIRKRYVATTWMFLKMRSDDAEEAPIGTPVVLFTDGQSARPTQRLWCRPNKRDAIIKCVGIKSEPSISVGPKEEDSLSAKKKTKWSLYSTRGVSSVPVKMPPTAPPPSIGVGPKEEDSLSAKKKTKWCLNGYGDAPKKTGKFSREESDIIKAAIEEYCAPKNVDNKALGSICPKLKVAWLEVAKKLPDRSVDAIYFHARKQIQKSKKTDRFSREESDIIKASEADVVMNNDYIKGRYADVNNDHIKGQWADVEKLEMVSIIRCWLHNQTNVSTSTWVDYAELAKLVDELKIKLPWIMISKRMGRRSPPACYQQWKLFPFQAERRAALLAKSEEMKLYRQLIDQRR
jgi:hypothetical protein